MRRMVCGLLLLAFLRAGPAESSVIIKADFDQVVQGSELIFEGWVVSKETRSHAGSGRPFTYFTFQIIDIIKGSYAKPTIEIGFMGGQVGELTLRVSDMRMPEVGERGVYFVESLEKQQVHPFFGWQQGHYLIINDPIIGSDVVVPVRGENPKAQFLELKQNPTLQEFKQNIRNLIKGKP